MTYLLFSKILREKLLDLTLSLSLSLFLSCFFSRVVFSFLYRSGLLGLKSELLVLIRWPPKPLKTLKSHCNTHRHGVRAYRSFREYAANGGRRVPDLDFKRR